MKYSKHSKMVWGSSCLRQGVVGSGWETVQELVMGRGERAGSTLGATVCRGRQWARRQESKVREQQTQGQEKAERDPDTKPCTTQRQIKSSEIWRMG